MTIAQCSQCTWRYTAEPGDRGPIAALHRHWRVRHEERYEPMHAASAVGGADTITLISPPPQTHMGGAA